MQVKLKKLVQQFLKFLQQDLRTCLDLPNNLAFDNMLNNCVKVSRHCALEDANVAFKALYNSLTLQWLKHCMLQPCFCK